ncbi:Zinc-regulated TonB-dependent outer membrane receptor [Chitinispirillum alkaliphilum]|nr:Zinc-regulated TonB-dependent outer membrane receptor [Chitinispirillum alkaliphilum]
MFMGIPVNDRHFSGRYDTEFELRAIELNIGAPVDPFFDALVTISYHEEEIELEEGWVSATLPLNLKLQVGREFIPFGYLNRIHEHDFPQADQPYVIEGLTTDHGFIGDGGHIEIMAPFFNPTLSLILGAYQNIGHSVGRRIKGTPVLARLQSYAQSPSGKHEFLYGASYLTSFGERNRLEGRNSDRRALGHSNQVAGLDFKYKFSPGGQTYRGLTVGAEYLYVDYEPNQAHNIYNPDSAAYVQDFDPGTDQGFYLFTHWNFNRFWGAGYRFDYTDVLFGSQVENEKLTAHSVYGEWRATEFSRIRLQYQHLIDPREDAPENLLMLQGTFFIGWHPPHRF